MSTPIPHKTLEDLAWPRLLEHLAARCHTTRGAAAAVALGPCASIEDARARIAEIAEARLLHELGAAPPFGGMKDVAVSLERAKKGGILDGPELIAVGETVAGCAALRRHLAGRRAEAPRLAAIAEGILELTHVSGPILDSFEAGGQLADHASPALGPLRRKVAQLHEELGRRVRSLLDDPAIAPHLQDRFYTQREERYVVPLKVEARARVKGIVHGTSQSGQTVFVEPEEIVDLNNRLKIAESDVAEEERRILAELSGYVREEAPAIRTALELAARLDLVDGAARLADALEACAPELDEAGALELRQARHPLMVLGGRECVPNDVALAPRTSLVISGPNAGGKTVALKTVGLAALMARAGLHVPAAPGSRLPWYATVLTDIGDEQSIERNLSTFSAHLLNLAGFLEAAREGALVLVDELATGTEPEQGAALAQAVLEALADRGAQVVATTHHERLKALPPLDPRFVNGSVGFDLERMAPTFKLHLGVPGSSGALLLARRLGFQRDVVGRAEALLGDRRAGVEELMTALAEQRRRLEAERGEAQAARREAQRAEREADAARRALEAERRELRRRAHDEAVAELRKARDELDALRARVRKAGAGADAAAIAADAKATLSGLAERVAGHAPSAPEPAGAIPRPEELVPGARVVIARLGGRGEVIAAPERGRITVQVGTLRTTVPIEDVRLDLLPPPNRRERRARAASGPPARADRADRAARADRTDRAGAEIASNDEDLAPMRTVDNTVDLRGERVEDALARLDQFIDDALLASRDVVFCVHGHGTGALKAAVREHLGMHAAVRRWRPGTTRDGGDGTTVIWLAG